MPYDSANNGNRRYMVSDGAPRSPNDIVNADGLTMDEDGNPSNYGDIPDDEWDKIVKLPHVQKMLDKAGGKIVVHRSGGTAPKAEPVVEPPKKRGPGRPRKSEAVA